MRARLLAAVLLALVAGCSATPPAEETPVHGHPTPPPPGDLRPGERFQALALARPYTPAPPAGGTDEYRCFLVDPRLTRPAFLTGSEFLPDNGRIVHNAILFRVPPDDVPAAEQLDARTPGDGWTCFGGSGIDSGDGATWLAAWAPGGGETVLPAGTGYAVPPGSRIVMQIHYSLLALDGGSAPPDRSAVRLRFHDDGDDLTPLRSTLLTAPIELPCAPGERGDLCDRGAAVADLTRRFGPDAAGPVADLARFCGARPGPTQSCDVPVSRPATVYAVAGHMHLLGRSIRVELNPGTADARTLLDVPVYDFDNQGARQLPEPVRVERGDTLRVTCTHDAGLRGRLPQLRRLPPRYVVWGDGTADEMCLGVLTTS